MAQEQPEGVAARPKFPSDTLLRKYFGRDKVWQLYFDGRWATCSSYDQLRNDFGFVLVSVPYHKLKLRNRDDLPFQPVYVFRQGKLDEQWLAPLEARGIVLSDHPGLEADLLPELAAHVAARPLAEWWRWCTVESSIWVEAIPEAVAAGKHTPPSLEELLKKGR